MTGNDKPSSTPAHATGDQPFRLSLANSGKLSKPILGMVERTIESLLGLTAMEEIYDQVRADGGSGHFVDKVLRQLRVRAKLPKRDLERIPNKGACVVVANHPFGGIEGMILASVVRRVRPDVKILANFLLARIPELQDIMIFVDPFGQKGSVARNLAGMRQAIQWVKNGGVLGIFPSGEVSHLDFHSRSVIDPPWSETVARLIRMAKAPVVPIFFEGHNGAMFQLAGLVHSVIRTAMLPRQVLSQRRAQRHMLIGNALPFAKLNAFENDSDMIAYLRLRTYILASRSARLPGRGGKPRTQPRQMQDIVAPTDPAELEWEINRLPKSQVLYTQGDQSVCYGRTPQFPHIVREIGRLREVTFRLAQEGTGRAIDLDPFDDYYLHLIIWNAKEKELVGAYRLGPTDEILPTLGIKGLYTSELFDYEEPLMKQLNPAIELGRAWIRPEYQRSYSPLMLLWKGIGGFLAQFPRYRMLFGPVSINSDYRTISQELMVTFLRAHKSHDDLAKWIHPKNPPRLRPMPAPMMKATSKVVPSIEEVNDLVSEIEADEKGVPILLKQYLRLNARILGFNLDPSFGDVLDGLVLVDVTQVEPKTLEKYMGSAAAKKFYAHHSQPTSH